MDQFDLLYETGLADATSPDELCEKLSEAIRLYPERQWELTELSVWLAFDMGAGFGDDI